MIEALAYLTILSVLAAVAGIGPWLTLVPRWLRHPGLMPALVPNCGLALLAMCAVPFLYLNLPVAGSLGLALVVSAALTAVAVRARGARALVRDIGDAARGMLAEWPETLAFAAVVILLLMPAVKGGRSSVPWRIGPDHAGHMQTAQFLREGGTFRQAAADIVREVGKSDEREAVLDNLQAVRFSAYVNADFLNKMHRVGYSAVLATLTATLGMDHVYPLAFPLLLLPHLLTMALTSFFCRRFTTLPPLVSGLTAVAIGLNCNLQNVLYEGMNGQFFATPLILLVFVIAFWIRSRPNLSLHDLIDRGHPDQIRLTGLFLAFACGALMVSFAEAVFLFGPTFMCMIGLDQLPGRRKQFASTVFLLAAFCGGLLLVWPQAAGWLGTVVFRVQYVKTSGFWQPHWATPVEIVGLKDIYASGRGYQLVPRAPGESDLVTAMSALIVAVVGLYLGGRPGVDRALWLSPPLYCLAVFLKNYFIDRFNNYQYMKSYTLWLVPICLLFVLSLWNLRRLSRKYRRDAVVLTIACLAAMIAVGAGYLWTMFRESLVVGPAHYELRNADRRLDFDQYVFLTSASRSHELYVMKYMMVPLIRMNWANESIPKHFGPHLDKKVALFAIKPELKNPDDVARKNPDLVLLNNDVFLIMKTGLRLQDVLAPDGQTIRFDVIDAAIAD
jgi:hypothetical protein